MAANPVRVAVAFAALALLAVPALAVSPAGPATDPAGDQHGGILDTLDGTALECRDPAFDVVASNVTLDSDSVDISVTMADLGGQASCGPVAVSPERIGVVHVYMNYSCATWCGETGHYLAVQHDTSGTTCVSIYSHGLGSSDGCTDLGGPATVTGDTLAWSIPRSGTYHDQSGTRSYSFNGPLDYYGVTYSEIPLGAVTATLEDQYAW